MKSSREDILIARGDGALELTGEPGGHLPGKTLLNRTFPHALLLQTLIDVP